MKDGTRVLLALAAALVIGGLIAGLRLGVAFGGGRLRGADWQPVGQRDPA
jgi:hypothetical protein